MFLQLLEMHVYKFQRNEIIHIYYNKKNKI